MGMVVVDVRFASMLNLFVLCYVRDIVDPAPRTTVEIAPGFLYGNACSSSSKHLTLYWNAQLL